MTVFIKNKSRKFSCLHLTKQKVTAKQSKHPLDSQRVQTLAFSLKMCEKNNKNATTYSAATSHTS